jgi:hypothetical protein
MEKLQIIPVALSQDHPVGKMLFPSYVTMSLFWDKTFR